MHIPTEVKHMSKWADYKCTSYKNSYHHWVCILWYNN